MSRLLLRLLTMALLAGTLALVPSPGSSARAPASPNVVFVYVDDMRADDLRYMDYTRRLFRRTGTSFTEAISPHPLCCPARAELMTGQYAQNNGVLHNRGEWGAHQALVEAGTDQLTPQWFSEAGYRTAYLGKYLNGYQGGDIPGVEVTDTLVRGVYSPTRFSTWDNGRITERRTHQTDWTASRTARLIARFSDEPFFITAAYLAPHAMKRGGAWVPPYRAVPGERTAVPPTRYRTLERGDGTPPSFSDPAFNEKDVSDKPGAIRDRALVSPAATTRSHQARVLSLYAVDDAVRRTVTALEDAAVFDDTVLAFTSDNGFQHGEHRTFGKDLPYQQSLRVPLLVRGPGVPVGRNHNVVTTVDVPGTLAGLAGVTPGRVQDGVNAFEAAPDRAVLIQSGGDETQWDWRGVYTRRFTYVEHLGDETEAYDRLADPHELDSDPDLREGNELAQLLDTLRDCVGTGCAASY